MPARSTRPDTRTSITRHASPRASRATRSWRRSPGCTTSSKTPRSPSTISAASSPDEIVDAVDALTKRPGETRQDYYARVRQNTRALQVKHADIDDNTDPARTALLDETTRARLAQKYAAAREALADV